MDGYVTASVIKAKGRRIQKGTTIQLVKQAVD